MRTAFGVFLGSLLLPMAAVGLVGANIGGAFAMVIVAMVGLPIVAEVAGEEACLLSCAAAALPAAGLAILARVSDSANLLAPSQWIAVADVVLSTSAAAAMFVRLLVRLRLNRALASAIVIFLSLAWLTWPVWLSPRLSGDAGDRLATALAATHPLLSINGAVPQFGLWTQQTYLYRLTTLGQDVNFTWPGGVGVCVTLHVGVAVVGGALAGGVRRWQGRSLRSRLNGAIEPRTK